MIRLRCQFGDDQRKTFPTSQPAPLNSISGLPKYVSSAVLLVTQLHLQQPTVARIFRAGIKQSDPTSTYKISNFRTSQQLEKELDVCVKWLLVSLQSPAQLEIKALFPNENAG